MNYLEEAYSEIFLSLNHSKQEKALEIVQTISVLNSVINDKVMLVKQNKSNGFSSK